MRDKPTPLTDDSAVTHRLRNGGVPRATAHDSEPRASEDRFTPARILCPVDFSEGSRHALDYAVALAHSFCSYLDVLYVHRQTAPVPAFGYPEVVRPLPLTDTERAGLLQSLAELVAGDRASGVPIDTLFEEALAVAPTIVECAAREQTDLIVVGTHGRTGFERLVLGSVANRVMTTAGCPVLVVPPRAPDAVPIAVRRVVCGVDFSPPSARALRTAGSLAGAMEARLTALHVLELAGDPVDRPPALSGYRAGRFARASAQLEAALTAVREWCTVDPLVVVGKPYAEILRIAADQQADVVVMGRQGSGALDRLTFGTTTHRVVRQASCPVLTVAAP